MKLSFRNPVISHLTTGLCTDIRHHSISMVATAGTIIFDEGTRLAGAEEDLTQ
jgi:hypothetical protein